MFTNIMFYVFSLLLMVGLAESAETLTEEVIHPPYPPKGITEEPGGRIIIGDDIVELRIIAEKHQSLENGIRFSVELENKLAEPISFRTWTLTEKEKEYLSRFRPGEKDLPFKFEIRDPSNVHYPPGYKEPGVFYFPDPLLGINLAADYRSNNNELHASTLSGLITINGNSTMELGSVIFKEYISGSKQDEDGGYAGPIIKNITPGAYTIYVYMSCYLVDDSGANDRSTTLRVNGDKRFEVILE